MTNKNLVRSVVFAALGIAAIGITSSAAYAGLTLTIDTVAEEYTFTGSAVVDPELEFLSGGGLTADKTAYWAVFNSAPGLGIGTATHLDLSGVTATADVGTVGNQPPLFVSPFRLTFLSGFGGTSLDIYLQFLHSTTSPTVPVDPGNITFSGDGVAYSYASLTPDQKTFLAGKTFPDPVPISRGTAVGPTDTFRINPTAVPEPSSFLFLGLVGLVGTAIRWFKRVGE